MNKFSKMLLMYVFYAVLCQLTLLMLLMLCEASGTPASLLFHRYFYLLEYPLTCLVLLIGGALLWEYILLNDDGAR